MEFRGVTWPSSCFFLYDVCGGGVESLSEGTVVRIVGVQRRRELNFRIWRLLGPGSSSGSGSNSMAAWSSPRRRGSV